MANMGIGRLGDPSVIIKQKYRWTLSWSGPFGQIPSHFVKVAARPRRETDEVELGFLNGTTWIPGKSKWVPLSVTYYDVADASMQSLYDWIATIQDFQDPATLKASEKRGWDGTGILTHYDGTGKEIEIWELYSAWPKEVDFGGLDTQDSDVATIDITFRYSEAKQFGLCGPTATGIQLGC